MRTLNESILFSWMLPKGHANGERGVHSTMNYYPMEVRRGEYLGLEYS